jgi:hypothetical protein
MYFYYTFSIIFVLFFYCLFLSTLQAGSRESGFCFFLHSGVSFAFYFVLLHCSREGTSMLADLGRGGMGEEAVLLFKGRRFRPLIFN